MMFGSFFVQDQHTRTGTEALAAQVVGLSAALAVLFGDFNQMRFGKCCMDFGHTQGERLLL